MNTQCTPCFYESFWDHSAGGPPAPPSAGKPPRGASSWALANGNAPSASGMSNGPQPSSLGMPSGSGPKGGVAEGMKGGERMVEVCVWYRVQDPSCGLHFCGKYAHVDNEVGGVSVPVS